MKASELIKQILNDMYAKAQNGQIMSPGWWVDKAVQLNALRQNLEDALIVAEMEYKREMVALIDEGEKITGAKLRVESSSEQYKLFKSIQAQSTIVNEAIMLSKKRAKQEHYE